jgi:hypothetical protein
MRQQHQRQRTPHPAARQGCIKLARIAFVSQVFNLVHRGIVFCGRSSSAVTLGEQRGMQVENLRYSRLKICATTELDAAQTAHPHPSIELTRGMNLEYG